MEVVTALVLLVSPEHVHVRAQVDGERLVYLGEVRGAAYAPLRRKRLRGR